MVFIVTMDNCFVVEIETKAHYWRGSICNHYNLRVCKRTKITCRGLWMTSFLGALRWHGVLKDIVEMYLALKDIEGTYTVKCLRYS